MQNGTQKNNGSANGLNKVEPKDKKHVLFIVLTRVPMQDLLDLIQVRVLVILFQVFQWVFFRLAVILENIQTQKLLS